MSLGHRVITGLLLVAVLLVAADVAVAGTSRRALLDEVDRRVAGQAGETRGVPPRAPTAPTSDGTNVLGDQQGVAERIPGSRQIFFEVRNADGTAADRFFPGTSSGVTPPELDAATVVAVAAPAGTVATPFTVQSADGTDWRVVVVAFADQRGYLVRGQSLAELDATFSRIVTIEVIATLVVLAGLALVAWWVIRLGVRPVNEMSDAALAIAAGDTDLRIPPAQAGTEAGKLSASLNTMIGRLDQARVEQQEASDRLRRFVADASHELRTPLTSVIGYTELLDRADLDPQERADLHRRLDSEAHHMSMLVEELLLLARLDEGRPLERRPVDLTALVGDVVSDVRAVQPDRRVTTRWPEQPVAVDGDDARLRQVAANLLHNACTHTPPGTPIEVAVTPEPGSVVLTVADHGPGLPAGTERKVFERFYRADPARSGPGNGLGLAIVDAICRAHGATVEAANRPDGGAVFTVRFPEPVGDATATPAGEVAQARPTTLAAT
ncbi:MAG: HAMP domain-containing sensor histidine kinase [Acidimicrobiales bacterium]